MLNYQSPKTLNGGIEYQRRYLNEHQAAQYLGVSVSLIRKLCRYRIGPSYTKLNNHCVRYTVEDLEMFAQSGRVEPEATS